MSWETARRQWPTDDDKRSAEEVAVMNPTGVLHDRSMLGRV